MLNAKKFKLAGLAAIGVLCWGTSAHALTINPIFDASITSDQKAAINQTISTIDGLYSNTVTLSVNFTSQNAGASFLRPAGPPRIPRAIQPFATCRPIGSS